MAPPKQSVPANESKDPVKSTEADDPLEKAEAAKEKKTGSTVDGMKGEAELDAAIEEGEK
jgi:hypothetical protein